MIILERRLKLNKKQTIVEKKEEESEKMNEINENKRKISEIDDKLFINESDVNKTITKPINNNKKNNSENNKKIKMTHDESKKKVSFILSNVLAAWKVIFKY